MKITLSFPKNGDMLRSEQVVEADFVPRKGELVSLDNAANLVVDDVVHRLVSAGRKVPRRIVVRLESPST
jgi:hypothetical protein